VGFDQFRDFLTDSDEFSVRQQVVSRWVGGDFVAGLRFGLNIIGRGDISIDWEDYYPWILEQVESVSEPFFLWVFLLEPHWPYRPPKRFRDGISLPQMYYHNWKQSNLSDSDPDDPEVLLRLYDGTIRYVDEFIERITTDLREYDPALVFHADHGEAFGEHGEYGHSDLYQENIHVPLLIAGTPERGRVQEPVSLKRLPDMIDAIRRNASHELPDYGETHVLSGNTNNYAIRGSGWKYVNRDGQELIYDLDSDPNENNPVVAEGSASDICQKIAQSKRSNDCERRLISQVAETFNDV
jgi:arylsulfatase